MIRSRPFPIAWLGCILLASCQAEQDVRGLWPPADFRLELQYAVVADGVSQVQQHVRIQADGLVVYREADTSLHSPDGAIRLPVFQRVCAYRMPWMSIRGLARDLHAAPVKELEAPPPVPSADGKTHRIGLRLTYMANRIDVQAENQVVGLLNRVVRIINARLPADHPITMPNMRYEALESALLDVPPVADSVAGAKGFHERWLLDGGGDPQVLRDTFALACTAKDWALARRCMARISATDPETASALAEILARSQ